MALAKHYGWGPDTVKKMTLDQQLMYIEGIAEGKTSSGNLTFDTLAEAVAYKQRRQALNA